MPDDFPVRNCTLLTVIILFALLVPIQAVVSPKPLKSNKVPARETVLGIDKPLINENNIKERIRY